MALQSSQPLIRSDKLNELASIARAIIGGHIPPSTLAETFRHSGPVYGELRQAGRLVFNRWESQSNQWASFCHLLQQMRQVRATDLLLCFCHKPKTIAGQADWKHAAANIQRGLSAYEIQYSNRPTDLLHVAPFAVIAQNRPFLKSLPGAGAPEANFAAFDPSQILAREFKSDQFYIDLQSSAPALRLFRCGRLVPLECITRSYVEQLRELLSRFLINSVQPDGRLTYLYYPSRGSEDQTKNNSIRQWMATRALCYVWERTSEPTLKDIIQKNIAYNLSAMYREEDGLGLIFDGSRIKLGAVALAALTLHESPFVNEHETIYRRLLTTVDALWRDDGQFRSFYRPADRMDCQNFYPGEALLLWATIILAARSSKLLERFWKSFDFYQKWHFAHRNPAFIPWHTQAYYKVWRVHPDSRLVGAVFMMNDWLLDVQQWEAAPTPDCQGRFYDPKRPFGPPHASSTGVYLEGLADAFATAREVGDSNRAARYRIAIFRGLRNIAQLTFKDDLDMFYVTKRDRLRGGVRTTEYNNVIRVDNVQHCLMAIHKVLDAFSESNFN